MAQYTRLNLSAGEALLGGYGLELRSMEPIAGGALNSSYLIRYRDRKGQKAKAVLTVLDSSTVEGAHRLATLLYSLDRCGVPVDGVIPTLGGELLVNLKGKSVILRPFVKGSEPDVTREHYLRDLGALLASFRGGTPVALDSLSELRATRRIPSGWRQQLGEEYDPELWDILCAAESIPVSGDWHNLPQTLCHGDLFPDNIIRKPQPDGSLVALDWEFASLDTAVLDIGIALSGSWKAVTELGWGESLAQIAGGYRAPERLDHTEVSQILPATLYGLALLAFRRNWVANVLGLDPRSDWHRELVERYKTLETMGKELTVDKSTPIDQKGLPTDG